MTHVIAVWPNNTTSFLVMGAGWTPIDLFYELDHIGDPTSAKVWICKKEKGEPFHATTDWAKKICHPVLALSGVVDAADSSDCVTPKTRGLRVSQCSFSGSIKRFRWPPNMLRQFLFASWRDKAKNSEVREALLSAECGKMLADLPSPPPPEHTAKEINAMEPFAGVYIAWNDDGTAHYVGESINVPARVQSSRPEIGDRPLGFIRCDKNERLRIESLFIGLLNPSGNCQSLERAAARDSRRTQK
jgi:hypothetical protein